MFTSRYNEPQDQDLLKTTTGLAISTAKRLILRVLYRIREACTCEYIYIHLYIYVYSDGHVLRTSFFFQNFETSS